MAINQDDQGCNSVIGTTLIFGLVSCGRQEWITPPLPFPALSP